MSRVLGKAEKLFYDKEYSFIDTIKRLWHYASKEKASLSLLFFILLINSLIAITLPFFIRDAIDELSNQDPDTIYIQTRGFFYLVGTVLEWLTLYYLIRIEWTIAAKTISRIRNDMFSRLQEHDLAFYDKNKTGRLMNRVIDDTMQFGVLILMYAEFFSQMILLVSVMVILFSISWIITLGVLATVPITIIFMMVIGKKGRDWERKCRRTRAAVNSAMQESVSGVSVAKGFSREKKNRSEFSLLNDENLQVNIRRSILFASIFAFLDFISILGMFVIIAIGAGQTTAGNLTLGELYLFYIFTMRLIGPIIGLSQQATQIYQGMAATERIFSLLEYPNSMKLGTKDPGELKGEIEFRKVNFSYNEETVLFDGLDLKIPAGQNIALVGHTGAGKTSFVSILSRFYEIQGGEILIDQKNLQELDVDLYRKNLGIVLQDAYLFSGSIRDNILYGKPEASDKELQQAIHHTHLEEFIDFLPEGLETDVHERGSRLSTGQRQLVTFARALIADPKILILDEATASVDAYTESLIQQSLANLLRGRTSIVVAHRLSTIINSDRILVFEEGKIVGDGTHEQLLKSNEVYRNLYKTYYEFQGLIEEAAIIKE